MRKLSTTELGRISPEAALQADKLPVVLVLDNLRSALNVGSVFRTADAFRAEALYLCGVTATPPHRDILKTALGATESVRWKQVAGVTDAIRELRSQGYTIAALEQATGSISLQYIPVDPDQKIAIVLGNEVSGVSDEVLPLCDLAIEIPQWGAKHSLNVSVCAGIVLWEFARKLRTTTN
jgi:23S rRNA (guanosine2251-2'-O)-methyltransferase